MVAPRGPSPLDAFAETAGEGVVDAFKVLGNETRLAILLALWEADASEPLPFSELQERVGMRDSGQFTYHLNQLVGSFLERTEDGYHLRTRAEILIGTVLSGWFQDASTFEDEPLDQPCARCGGPLVMDYGDGLLTARCTRCEGVFTGPDLPAGTNYRTYRPPAALTGRTPQEFAEKTLVWSLYRGMSCVAGACPWCGGRVSVSGAVCEDHEVRDASVCDRCGSPYPVLWTFGCDVCRYRQREPPYIPPVVANADVQAFLHDHGLDFLDAIVRSGLAPLEAAVAGIRVRSRDPLLVGVAFELGGDRLEVDLDGSARVVGMRAVPGPP